MNRKTIGTLTAVVSAAAVLGFFVKSKIDSLQTDLKTTKAKLDQAEQLQQERAKLIAEIGRLEQERENEKLNDDLESFEVPAGPHPIEVNHGWNFDVLHFDGENRAPTVIVMPRAERRPDFYPGGRF